jgi:hypothetical protein
MGSEASPSFKEVNMYDFIDRAYHLVISEYVAKKSLEYLDKLIVKKEIIVSYDYSNARFLRIDDSLNDYFLFIGGNILVYNKGTSGPSSQKIALEQVSIEYLEILTDTTNKTYYRNPKILLGDAEGVIFIIPDYYTTIDISTKCMTLRYISIPKKFEDMWDTEEPVVSDLLHLDIVEKAAELMSSTLNPGAAAQEIQNNNQIAT